MAQPGERPVEKARHEPCSGEPEEKGGRPIPARATQDFGECPFPGEDRPVRQDEVHRPEACGLRDRGKPRPGLFGSARQVFEGVADRGVATYPVGGRTADRAIRVVDQYNRGGHSCSGRTLLPFVPGVNQECPPLEGVSPAHGCCVSRSAGAGPPRDSRPRARRRKGCASGRRPRPPSPHR